MQMNINFSIAERNVRFSTEELTFKVVGGKIKSILGLSHAEKTSQVHKRQRFIIENTNEINSLLNKQLSDPDKSEKYIWKKVDWLVKRNKNLLIEISKLKAGATFDLQEDIIDYPQYTKIRKAMKCSDEELHDLGKVSVEELVAYEIMNTVLSENPVYFTNFIADALIAAESDTVIPLLKKVGMKHGIELKDKQIA